MRRHKFPASFLILVLFISCATSPGAGPAPEDGAPDFSVFPQGADLYLWADVERAKDLLEALAFEGTSGRDASQILERTDTALAAFYPENAPRRFFLAGWGNYPNLRAGLSMSFNSNWKKVKSETGNRYWYSAGNKLGIALGSRLAFASDGDPFSPGQGADPAPRGFEEFRRACVLSGWLNDPGVSINGFIDELGLPLQIPAEDFFFGVIRLPFEESWELAFRIKTPSANNARSLVSLINLARFFMGKGPFPQNGGPEGSEPLSISPQEAVALLFANDPEQNEEFLTIRTGPLAKDRIALLFTMFSLYSEKH